MHKYEIFQQLSAINSRVFQSKKEFSASTISCCFSTFLLPILPPLLSSPSPSTSQWWPVRLALSLVAPYLSTPPPLTKTTRRSRGTSPWRQMGSRQRRGPWREGSGDWRRRWRRFSPRAGLWWRRSLTSNDHTHHTNHTLFSKTDIASCSQNQSSLFAWANHYHFLLHSCIDVMCAVAIQNDFEVLRCQWKTTSTAREGANSFHVFCKCKVKMYIHVLIYLYLPVLTI